MVLASCGGSKHVSSSAATTPTTSKTTSATSASSTGRRTGITQTPAATTTSTSRRSASHTSAAGSGSSGGVAPVPRIPATFKIQSGDRLTPSTVSAPTKLAVQLTLVSTDGQVHHAVLRTPKPYPLTVPAGGRATMLIPGQLAGHYSLDLDGRPRGALIIGVNPGP